MSLFRFPRNDFDRADQLLALIGSFWSDVYIGSQIISDTLAATTREASQSYLQLLELLASISRQSVPLFHTENWHALTIRASQINATDRLQLRYGSGEVYGDNSVYGQKVLSYFAVEAPENLADVRLITDKLVTGGVQLQAGVDFHLTDGLLVFYRNPFDNPAFVSRDLLSRTGEPVDREITLWLFRGQWDWQTVYKQFGYVLGLHMRTSEGYKQLLNAVLDAFCHGTSQRTQQLSLAAVFGVPLVIEPTETVEEVIQDGSTVNVITDRHVYQYPTSSRVLVSVGDVVTVGQCLTDTLQIVELHRGQEVSPDILPSLAIGPELLEGRYVNELVFENAIMPVDIDDTEPRTRVTWAVSGFPADVDYFWDNVHAKGIRTGQTLAEYLDKRQEKIGQPSQIDLPTEVNPLQFLLSNLLRNNVTIVRIRLESAGESRLEFVPEAQLRKLQPPHTLTLYVLELVYADNVVTISQPGDAVKPGSSEALSSFSCGVASDSLGPSNVSERVRIKLLSGKCV